MDAFPPLVCVPSHHALAQMIKPVYGFLSDAVPIFGYRRCSYLAICGMAGAASWAGMAGLATTPTAVVALLLLGSATTACADVVADSVVVELVRRPGAKLVRAFKRGLCVRAPEACRCCSCCRQPGCSVSAAGHGSSPG